MFMTMTMMMTMMATRQSHLKTHISSLSLHYCCMQILTAYSGSVASTLLSAYVGSTLGLFSGPSIVCTIRTQNTDG